MGKEKSKRCLLVLVTGALLLFEYYCRTPSFRKKGA